MGKIRLWSHLIYQPTKHLSALLESLSFSIAVAVSHFIGQVSGTWLWLWTNRMGWKTCLRTRFKDSNKSRNHKHYQPVGGHI